MNGKIMLNVPFQDDVSILLRILASAWSLALVNRKVPTTAKALLEKNLTRGSVVMTAIVADSGYPGFKSYAHK